VKLYQDVYFRRNKLLEHLLWQDVNPGSSKCFSPSILHQRLVKNITVEELGCTEEVNIRKNKN